MGLGAVAGHLVIMITLASAGTAFVSAAGQTLRTALDAQSQAVDRLLTAANERVLLDSGGYRSSDDTVFANITNNSSREMELDKVTLIVDGSYMAQASADVFQVRGATSSGVWMPGEIVEVEVSGLGDVDIGISGRFGASAYRRA